jgi:acetyl esterase/lipase
MTAALPARREGRAASPELVATRAQIDGAARDVAPPPGIDADTVAPGGVPASALAPADAGAPFLWLHGGGYRMGSPRAWSSFGSRLARHTATRVVLADYGLAPEHPYPGGLLDAFAAYTALAEPGEPVLVGGDSAGGGLAVALALLCRAEGAALPTALVLLSPWADLTVTAPSYASNAEHDQMFSRASALEAVELYLQGHPGDDPLVSPCLAELAGLPPTIVFASEHEVLRDDACSLAQRLAEGAVPTELHLVPDVPHVWPFMAPEHVATAHALDDIARFTRRALGAP